MIADKIKGFLVDHIIEVVLLILVVTLWIVEPTFMTFGNITNMFRSISIKGLLALGMTLVIICGQIDLSVGQTVALTSVIVARFCRDLGGNTATGVTIACIIGIFVSLMFAGGVGAAHGYLQDRFNMHPFILTLCTQNLLYGLAGIVCKGYPIANAYPEWFNWIGSARLGSDKGIPVVVLIFVFFVMVTYVIMNKLTIGRAIYAVGGNPEAARLNGIDVLRTKMFAMITIQVLSVLAGIMNAAQLQSGTYTYASTWAMDAITAVVLGGAAMEGGRGRLIGTVYGIIFVGVLTNGMTLLNISTYMQYCVRAGVMLFAILVSTVQLKKSR